MMRRLSPENSNNKIVSRVRLSDPGVGSDVRCQCLALTLSVVPVSADGPGLARPDPLPVAEVRGDPEPVPLAPLVPLPA